MGKLAHVSADRLREELAEATGAKGALRLVVALDYKDGEPVDALSRRYGIPASTLYSWLDRFEERPVADAIEDESRPGRPNRLTADERAELAEALEDPSPNGDADRSTESVRDHIEERYGVRYSLGHVRRLRRELAE